LGTADRLCAAASCRCRCTKKYSRARRETCRALGGSGASADRLQDPEELIPADIEETALPRWFAGRVVLLGDAAHAMTRNLGQGAGMAVEDAYVLAEQLRTRASVPEALSRWGALK